MKEYCRKYLKIAAVLFVFAVIFTLSKDAAAETNVFKDGIFTYQITDEVTKTVAVISCSPDAAAEEVEILDRVSYNGTEYTVTSLGRENTPVVFPYRDQGYKIKTITFPDTITGNISNLGINLEDLKSLVFKGSTAPTEIEVRNCFDIVIYVPEGTEEAYRKVINDTYEYSPDGLIEKTLNLEPNVAVIGTVEIQYNNFIKDNMMYQVTKKASGGTGGEVKLIGNYRTSGAPFLMLPEKVINGSYTYTLTELDDESLYRCRAEWIFMPDTIKVIGNYLFDDKVTHVFLSHNIKAIQGPLFTSENNDFPLRYIYLPEGITKIGSNAFARGSYDNLIEMIIPSTVKTLETDALASVKTIVFMGKTPVKNLYKALGSGSKAFIYANSYAKNKVVKTMGSSKPAYQKALKDYIGKITFTTKKAITKATGLTLNKELVSVSKGKTSKVKVTLSGKGTNESVQWVSADTGIAKVSSKGTVTGISKGTTYVMAYTLTTGLHQIVKVTVK